MTGPSELVGALVRLRPLRRDDLAPLAAILAEPEVAEWWHGYDADRVRQE